MIRRSPFSAWYAIPALVAVAGIGMLVYAIGLARPLWVDEEMILLNVRDRAWHQLAEPLWLDQSAPLGWFMLERTILLVFGDGERTLRFLTGAFGAATLITALWIGRRWMTPLGAAILVAMCATSEWLVFFTLELKHYSSDAFWALLLPALAAWAIDAREQPEAFARRARAWWLIAAIGQWFGNGALFVSPAVGVALISVCWRRGGFRGLQPMAVGVAAWLLSFGFNFLATLRPALDNAYLKNYWAFAFPPVAEGLVATARWVIAELRPRAVKPASTELWLLFWTTWAGGIVSAITRREALGWMYASVPFAALMLAVLHVVPPFERLGLWFVPSLYVGVALCADAAVRSISSRAPGGAVARAVAAIAGIAALVVSADVVFRGVRTYAERPRSNYGLDDRSSIRYLLATHRPGDPILTTHYGTAALWWYGRVNIAGPDGGTRLPDGSPVFEVKYPDQTECGWWDSELTRTLAGHTRADLYLGYRNNVEPDNFDALVLSVLSKRGRMVGYKEYAQASRIATFDLSTATGYATTVPGCISIRPAKRW